MAVRADGEDQEGVSDLAILTWEDRRLEHRGWNGTEAAGRDLVPQESIAEVFMTSSFVLASLYARFDKD